MKPVKVEISHLLLTYHNELMSHIVQYDVGDCF